MKIVIVNRERIEIIPPLVSIIQILTELGHSVVLVTGGIGPVLKEKFCGLGVELHVIPQELNCSLIKKVKNVTRFRKYLSHYLKTNSFDFIWSEGYGAYTWAADIFEKYPLIMNVSELYEGPEEWTVRFAFKRLIHKAKAIVMPEYNRATYFQTIYKLSDRPFVLPNKPYYSLSGQDVIRCTKQFEKELSIFKEKKVILYQGVIQKDRDLSNYVRAVKELGDEYRLVLLGDDRGTLKDYLKIDSDLIHIPFVPAPDYLIFTAHAYAGIVTYDPMTMNSAYCAPNKIYEYAMYGLPMIGNDIPGLKYTIGLANAGIIVDDKSIESIKNGILEINDHHDYYSKHAREFNQSTNNIEVIRKIIDKASSK